MEKLIYAILSSNEDTETLTAHLSDMKGISGAELSVVRYGTIAAIISDIRRTELIADQSNAIAYAGVIEALVKSYALLPVRFGSVMESNDAISKMIERNDPDIRSNLQKVDGKQEFGLRIFCVSSVLRAELIEKSELEVKNPPLSEKEITYSASREWVNKKLKEHRFEELLLVYVDSVITQITSLLSRLNAVSDFKKMVSATHIVDAVFLLEKDKQNDLVDAVKALQSQHPGLTFILTGPWPPYSFVDFTVR